jgi:hypothetical protein
MAETRTRVVSARRPKKVSAPVRPSIDFHRKNLYLMILASVTIIAGYVLLAAGNEDQASILLVVGYLGLIPFAILAK